MYIIYSYFSIMYLGGSYKKKTSFLDSKIRTLYVDCDQRLLKTLDKKHIERRVDQVAYSSFSFLRSALSALSVPAPPDIS